MAHTHNHPNSTYKHIQIKDNICMIAITDWYHVPAETPWQQIDEMKDKYCMAHGLNPAYFLAVEV